MEYRLYKIDKKFEVFLLLSYKYIKLNNLFKFMIL